MRNSIRHGGNSTIHPQAGCRRFYYSNFSIVNSIVIPHCVFRSELTFEKFCLSSHRHRHRCTHTHTHAHSHTYTHHTHTQLQTHTVNFDKFYISSHAHTHRRTHTHARTRTHTHTHRHTDTRTHTHKHTHTHTHTRTLRQFRNSTCLYRPRQVELLKSQFNVKCRS